MVIGEQVEGGEATPPSPQQYPPQKATIENIMSGIENTGAVRMNNHRKKLRQRFDIIKKLGQGTYGKVQLGINKETGQEVAIKTIKKSKIETEADLIRIRREVQIMSSVQHPNIIHIYEVFENREKMVLVMEFAAGGELYDYLSERKVLAEEEARRIFRQVSTAIYYCHKHKICHRDLKLENILLDENGNAKIADFGLSNVFDEQRLLATFCGSPLYASPEIVKGTPYQGPEVDCWSLGVLLYTLVYGAMPFDGANFKRLVKQISQGDYFEPKKPSRASPLIREMLTVCPSHRANIEQICNHWWVNEGYDESCLDLAEELANQTPVRLDVLLSLAPPSVTADQLLVGNGQEDAKSKDRIQRSHSMGSIVDMGGTEAERRILDMVAAGGEAALMPSPTRTITPAETSATGSPAQAKRKLETTVSTENATGAVKKKDKADPPSPAQPRIPEDMDVEELEGSERAGEPEKQNREDESKQSAAETAKPGEPVTPKAGEANKFQAQEVLDDLQNLENMCDELLLEAAAQPHPPSVQPESSVANGTPAASAEVGTPETPTKPVSSVRAKLEKLEKAGTEQKPTVTAIPAMRKVFGKNKTTDLTSAINEVHSRRGGDENQPTGERVAGLTHRSASSVERKNSLPDENLARTAERRKSRILETAEKFQNLNQTAGNGEKFKKFVIPGGGVPTVGNYKKEFERKTGLNTSATFTKPPPPQTVTVEQKKGYEQDPDQGEVGSTPGTPPAYTGSSKNLAGFQQAYDEHGRSTESPLVGTKSDDEVKESDSKSSIGSFSLEDARRSMENSIAMLNRAKPVDSSAPSTPTSIDQLCARTESVSMMEDSERERKLKNAREIIGNAIPIGRLRKPPMPFGANGRSTTGTLGINKPFRLGSETPEPRCDTMSIPRKVSIGSIPSPPKDETKTSHAEITLKSATLPRRKLSNKPQELLGDAQQKIDHRMQQPPPPAFAPMRFSTEIQHQMPDLRSAPIGREHPPAFAPMAHQHQQHLHQRANSLEPQGKDQQAAAAAASAYASQQKPPTYQRTMSGAYGAGYGSAAGQQASRGTLSRQSTNESNDSDNTISQGPMSTNASGVMSSTLSTSGSTTMPIKKSPREFIIPIAVEGGGFVTPRANSLEPSESNASSGVSGVAGFGMKPRLARPRRLGSLLTENDGESGDMTSFPRLNRHTSLGRESDSEEPKFHMMHRLRSSRPSKRGTADPNESASSGEEDDDDGFEILTAENLFSTLLSRVRALTNRLNVNDVNSPRFPASRFMNNLRQTQAPFWQHQDPFGRHLNEGTNAANAWRHSMSRDLSTDIDSMFSRSGATLPRGTRLRTQSNHVTNSNNSSNQNHYHHHHHQQPPPVPPNSSSNSIRSSYNNRYSYHPTASNHLPTTHSTINSSSSSSFYKDLASLAAYGNGGGGGREASCSSPPTSGGDESVSSSATSTSAALNGNGFHTRHTSPGEATEGSGTMEENLDLRDLDLSQLRLSKRDLETLSSITPALSQRVQEQLLAQLPPQQARKLSRTLSMQNGAGGVGPAGTGPSAANQRLYRRSYSNSSGNRSLDATSDYGAWSGSGVEARRRAGSQPRDIVSPPPAYQSPAAAPPAPLYEKYAPYGSSSIPAISGDSSGMSSFGRRSSPHTGTRLLGSVTGAGSSSGNSSSSNNNNNNNTGTTPHHRYTVLGAGAMADPTTGPSRRLSRFLRPDFFDPPKEQSSGRTEPSGGGGGGLSPTPTDRVSPFASGVTLREDASGRREQRREKLANDTITDRLSYFLEKYGKSESGDDPHERTPPGLIGDRTRRSLSRSRETATDGASRSAAETLSLLQEQLQDLTSMSSLAAGAKLLRESDNSTSTTTEPLPGATDCGEFVKESVEATTEPVTNGTSTLEDVKEDVTVQPPTTVKKVVKVKKVKVVKKVSAVGTSEPGDKQPTVNGAPPEATVTVKKTKKLEPTVTADVVTTVDPPPTAKKESKLMRPRSYPFKEAVQDAKLTVVGDISLELDGKEDAVGPGAAVNEATGDAQKANGGVGGSTNEGPVSTTSSKIARPKSFPSSKLTPPKELKLLKSPGSDVDVDKTVPAKAEASVTATTGSLQDASNAEVTGTPTSTVTSPPKKVKKVIRIVKKVTKTTDSNGKVVVTTTTIPVDQVKSSSKDGGSGTKETSSKTTVTVKDPPSPAFTSGSSPADKPATKEKSKSPEKKPKQGFLASIGQRFEKFRDTSKSNKEKKAAAAAASAAATTAATVTSCEPPLPDTAVPAMVPVTAGLDGMGITPDVLVVNSTDQPTAGKKDKEKKKSKSTAPDTVAGASEAANKAGQTTSSERKSRIDTVIRNLRELSTVPKLPEVTESKLIKRAVSVEEMPGTFNRCGVTKVLGLFRKIEKDSRNNHHHRLLNTKSSSHILTGGRGRTADEGLPVMVMPDLTQPSRDPGLPRDATGSPSLHAAGGLPVPVSSARQKLYGGARSDTALPVPHHHTLLPNGGGEGEGEQRKFRVAATPQSQIPVKYGCPGCGSGSNGTVPDAGKIRGAVDGGGHDRRGRARALTIDLEQAVHSATEKLKRLQQANSIPLYSNIPPTQAHPYQHPPQSNNNISNISNNHNNNNNYINNPSNSSLSASTKIIPPVLNGTSNTQSCSPNPVATSVGGNSNYSYPPPLPSEIVASPGGTNNNNNNGANGGGNMATHHHIYSTLTPSYDSITNYSSGSRSSPYDDNSSSTFLSPSEERELYFDSWSVCSDELAGTGGGGGTMSPVTRRHSVRLLTPNQPVPSSVSPVDLDAESVIERIRRKSFYTRFNEKKPAKRASAGNLGALMSGNGGGSGGTSTGRNSPSAHGKDLGGYGYYGAGVGTREKSLSRGGSSSYILQRPTTRDTSFGGGGGGGKYDTAGYATVGRTEHPRGYATMVSLGRANRAARLRNSSLDVVPGGADYPVLNHHHHLHQPHHHHHHHHHHHQQPVVSLSRTGSRLLATDDDPLTDGLAYSNILNNNNNNTMSHKYTRNTYYDSSTTNGPSPYGGGTYTPRRRSSFVGHSATATGYGSSNVTSSSSSIVLDLLKDHRDRDGSASQGNLATTASSSSSTTLSASENYGGVTGGGGSSSSVTSRNIRPYEARSSSLLTPATLREAGRYGGRYDSGTLTKTSYRTRTTSTSKSTDNA